MIMHDNEIETKEIKFKTNMYHCSDKGDSKNVENDIFLQR